MPLIPTILEAQILAAFQKMSSGAGNLESAQQELARDLTAAIDTYIKSATIIVPPGQAVVAGSIPGPGSTVAPSPPAIIA